MDTDSSRRRGRSVSRAPDRAASQGKGFSHSSTSRRRRSISFARRRRINLELMVRADQIYTPSSDVQPKSSNFVQAMAQIRRNYTAKLEQSEKRKQDLLAQLAVEEEHGQELTTIVQELLPLPTRSIACERQLCSRRWSSDQTRISKQLTEEAERYFDDFLSSVEDTDISSFDGERSDTSSVFKNQRLHSFTKEARESTLVASEPFGTDGILLPWLQWETSADPSPSWKSTSCRSAVQILQETMAGFGDTGDGRSLLNPEGNESCSVSRYANRSYFKLGNQLNDPVGGRSSLFNTDEYSRLQHSEDLLFEMFRQRQRLYSGSMILCRRCLI